MSRPPPPSGELTVAADRNPSVVLDWRHHDIGTRTGKCRRCRRPAWMRDEDGRPGHKVCAEAAAEAAAARAADGYRRREVA